MDFSFHFLSLYPAPYIELYTYVLAYLKFYCTHNQLCVPKYKVNV